MQINPADIRTLIHIVTQKTGTPVHDEDLEQDVALRALEACRRLRSITHPKALLRKIVHDTVRDYWRRRRRNEGLHDLEERFAARTPELESEVDRRRRIDLLRRAMAQLPDSKRQLIELFYVQDLSIAEIAGVQRRSISAVKMDLVRSRRSLSRIVQSCATKKSRLSRQSRHVRASCLCNQQIALEPGVQEKKRSRPSKFNRENKDGATQR